MYAVGARAAQDPFVGQAQAYVQTLDGQFVPVARPGQFAPIAQPLAYAPAAQPVSYVSTQPVPTRTVVPSSAPRQTVYRSAEPQERVVYRETEPRRSWTKTALIIGGSTASGAGVGGIVGGKKGALVGAAIGGGAASIYEATRRR
jgi:hypothetical protein